MKVSSDVKMIPTSELDDFVIDQIEAAIKGFLVILFNMPNRILVVL